MPLVTADEEILLTRNSLVEVEAELVLWKESATPEEKSSAAEALSSRVEGALNKAPSPRAITGRKLESDTGSSGGDAIGLPHG